MENYATGDEAANAMKEISHMLYDYFWRPGTALAQLQTQQLIAWYAPWQGLSRMRLL